MCILTSICIHCPEVLIYMFVIYLFYMFLCIYVYVYVIVGESDPAVAGPGQDEAR